MKTKEFTFNTTGLTFYSNKTRCAATLYLPDGVTRPPVIIMGNGFGAERTILMPAFAERFARRGMACFLFDYRNFGDSLGSPRKLVSHRRHLRDWQAALQYVRTLDSLNHEKIALWGTSYSGGHAIVTAAKTEGISAIVGQVPFVDGIASASGYSIRNLLKGFFHGMADILLLAATFGHSRHTVPILCEPDTFGMLNTPGSNAACKKIIPGNFWDDENNLNACPAIVTFTLPLYRPTRHAAGVTCPALIIHAEKDNLIPVASVKKAVKKMKQVTYVGLPLGHFDIYEYVDKQTVNPHFEKVAELETEFLEKNLITG